MKRLAFASTMLFAVMAAAHSAETPDEFKPLKSAQYMIFSGNSVNEPEPPSKNDRKLSIVIDGKAAKEIFDEIGPDQRHNCNPEKGDRQRVKGGVECRFTASSKPGSGSYQCWVGMDLKTGKSEHTVGC